MGGQIQWHDRHIIPLFGVAADSLFHSSQLEVAHYTQNQIGTSSLHKMIVISANNCTFAQQTYNSGRRVTALYIFQLERHTTNANDHLYSAVVECRAREL